MTDTPEPTVIMLVIPQETGDEAGTITVRNGNLSHMNSFQADDFATLCRALNNGMKAFARLQADPPAHITSKKPKKTTTQKPAGKPPYKLQDSQGNPRSLNVMFDPFDLQETYHSDNPAFEFDDLNEAEAVATTLIHAGMEKAITITFSNGKAVKTLPDDSPDDDSSDSDSRETIDDDSPDDEAAEQTDETTDDKDTDHSATGGAGNCDAAREMLDDTDDDPAEMDDAADNDDPDDAADEDTDDDPAGQADHIIAVHSYGAHRVKHSDTGKKVSAQKIGYLTAAADVLLALYGDRARDVSSRRASYRYIDITGETSIRYGYLLLKLTDAELQKAETITEKADRAGVYIYRGDAWYQLPDKRQPDYRKAAPGSGPDYDPTDYHPVSPSASVDDPAPDGEIIIRKSQRDPAKKAWFWIHGDTYPHRELLKQHGGRWSRKRKAWYIIAHDLPDVIQQLVDDPAGQGDKTVDDDSPDEEAAEQADETTAADNSLNTYQTGETVYAAGTINRDNDDLTTVPKATRGTVMRVLTDEALMQRIQMIGNGWHNGVSYQVAWDIDDQTKTAWVLEDELSREKNTSPIETGKRAIIGGGNSGNLIDEVPSSDTIRALIIDKHGHPTAAGQEDTSDNKACWRERADATTTVTELKIIADDMIPAAEADPDIWQQKVEEATTGAQLRIIIDDLLAIWPDDADDTNHDYPDSIQSEAQRAIYDIVDDETKTLSIYKAINDVRKHGWKTHQIKQREVKQAIFRQFSEAEQLDPALEAIIDAVFQVALASAEFDTRRTDDASVTGGGSHSSGTPRAPLF